MLMAVKMGSPFTTNQSTVTFTHPETSAPAWRFSGISPIPPKGTMPPISSKPPSQTHLGKKVSACGSVGNPLLESRG